MIDDLNYSDFLYKSFVFPSTKINWDKYRMFVDNIVIAIVSYDKR